MFIKRWKIFWQVLVVTIALVLLKYLLYRVGWEVLSVTSLHSSILAGSVFVLGFILSSTHTDYKESEKMPTEIVSAIESLHQDGVLFFKDHPNFPFDQYQSLLAEIPLLIKRDIEDHTQESLPKIKSLADFIKQMEKLDMPANYVVKMKQDQGTVLKAVMRMYYLLRIKPLPSAFILVEFIVVTVIGMLMLTKMTTLIDGLIVTGFFAFLYIYILRLIRVMDLPFHKEGTTQDDVSLFLLEQQHERFKN